MILMSRHPSFGETVSGRQTACAGRHPAFIAGVKIGRAALWDFFCSKNAADKGPKKTCRICKKGVDKQNPPCYNNHR